MKHEVRKGFVKAKPIESSIKKFISQASVSGGVWRPHEIATFENLEMSKPILDIGCGDGQFVRITFSNKLTYGMDISEKNLIKAKSYNTYRKYLLGDIHTIPLPNNSIKTVFSNSVFEHIENLEPVIKEINRVLKFNGKLIFTTHLPSSRKFNSVILLRKLRLTFIANWVEKIFIKQLQLVTLWTPDQWKKTLGKNGFEIEETKGMISDKSFLQYELFQPLTFLQNRVKLLKKIPITKLIMSLLNIDYKKGAKRGYNIFIVASKKRNIYS